MNFSHYVQDEIGTEIRKREQDRARGEIERALRLNGHEDGIYPPDRNLYLVANTGENRAARRLANKGKKK